ncbi:MAG: threonine--tRNA ligase [Parcubacteria group bacterium]|nr:threonine--tRNA ligase [Parcubacteria group bacterium]
MKKQNKKLENIRHSLAHLLAASVLKKFPGAKLGIGPVIENGFYYDFLLPRNLTPEDLNEFEKEIKKMIGQKLSFSGKKITPAEAKKLFRNQQFKLELIKELISGSRTSAGSPTSQKLKKVSIYKTGDVFIDLCAGPHVKNTREINSDAFRLTHSAGAYWRGNEKKPQLQRIYGVAFETKKDLEHYLWQQEEAKKRDHRKIGKDLDLFSFHDVSPGATFWHPKGMIIFKELEKFWRKIHEEAGYQEISTPILVKENLFKQSGHLENYKENMYPVKIENETYYLKPMNCPESAIIYSSKIRSYKDLPIRLSEIGRLHRAELSGVLAGLFRVRQITMDDAHIYCRPSQIQIEIGGVLKLIKNFYKLFGFNPEFNLSTRPDKAMGDPALWKKAEAALEIALKKNNLPYKLKPKDGAFYGPKIDVHITDSLGRPWQLATIQLDFQMPERFDLSYQNEKSQKEKPVMIHRAIFGSFERFIGVLIENFNGALPLWLSPIQAIIIPIASRHIKYAKNILDELKKIGPKTELDERNETIGKKIREAQLQKISYILIVGDEEIKNKTVNVRHYRRGQEGEIKTGALIEKIKKEIENKTI